MGAADTVGAILAMVFATLVIVFVTLGCVLLAFFWAKQLSVTLRAALATGLGAVVLLGPISLLSGGDIGFVPLIVAVMLFAILGFPVAFLATRKLDRQKQAISAIFD